MGRRPSVFVRPVSMEEGRKLQRISLTAKAPVRLRRAIVVLMSAQGQTVKDITSLMQVSADYVRDVIHAFSERGFDSVDPKWSGGRPKAISERVREHIRLIARTSPAGWNITAFSTWSLAKLAEHLVERHVVPKISRETLRRILREGKVSWQATGPAPLLPLPDDDLRRLLGRLDLPGAPQCVVTAAQVVSDSLMPGSCSMVVQGAGSPGEPERAVPCRHAQPQMQRATF